jgi:hypothetical protein
LKKIEQRLRPDLLRIRNNVTIKQLNFTDEQIETVKQQQGFGKKYWICIRQILSISACCLCGKIPEIELKTDLADDDGKIIKVEYYCKDCIEKVFTKEPQDIAGLEEMYNFRKVSSLPPSEASP